jgi:ubiquinone/menaquinone biosynthesis C-methylase UbiE
MLQEAFWDKRARKYDDDIVRHDDVYLRTIDSTRSLLSDSDVVLDLGCGSGEIGLDIAHHVRRLKGIDVSEKMIELAEGKMRTRRVGNAEFRRGDAFDERLAAGSFSAVTAFNVFHLVDDMPGLLARLRELLQPGGLLISQTPCLAERSRWLRALVGLAQRLELAPPIRSLTFGELEALVSDADFEILEVGTWDEEDAVRRIVARRSAGEARPATGLSARATPDLTPPGPAEAQIEQPSLAIPRLADSRIPPAIEADAMEGG